jgi:hypothetical protein
MWTLRIENEGARWLRVPADVRLLHFTVESGDTVSKKVAKPVKCPLPAGLRPEGFPERNALLLGPGDAYVEAFDPRLFCFGKEGKALAGGALVRASYGWESPGKGAPKKKVEPPFAVEGTVFPAEVLPKKLLVVPSMVLSWLPPDEEEQETAEAAPAAAPSGPPVFDKKHPSPHDPEKAVLTDVGLKGHTPDHPSPEPAPPPGEDKPPAAKLPADENAPRLELTAGPYVDASHGRKVTVTVTVTNVGHRAALAAIRSRMLSFVVDGPDERIECPAAVRRVLPREGYTTLKPGGSTSLSVLVVEACGRELFRRPGLYRIVPTLHLTENGADLGLMALTGSIRAVEPTVVRIAEGPDPFYKQPPRAVRAPRAEGDEGGGS